MKKTEPRHLLWIFLVAVYLIVRFGFAQQLDELGLYGSYIFEMMCAFFAICLYGQKFQDLLKLRRPAAFAMPFALFAGFGIFKLAGPLGIMVPFDLRGAETVLFLLLVAPILEELLFRFFLWQPLQILTGRPLVAWVVTTLIFSYSHLHAIWFVEPEIHPFIWYQTAYTLVLGGACGYYVYRHASLTSAIFIHFAFNFGFYLGATI